MKTKLLSLILLIVFCLSTNHTEAYVSGTKTATRIDNTYRLYSIDFSWGFSNQDLLIPVLAKRGIKNGDTTATLGYDIVNQSGLRIKTGTTTSMVIANLPIENGYYRLSAGKKAKFQLLALHESASSTQPLKLQVSSLPFKFDTAGKITNSYLHPHELKGYLTESI